MKSFVILTSNMLNGMIFKSLLLALNCVSVYSQFRGHNANQNYQAAGNQFNGFQQQPHPNQGFQQQEKKQPDIIPANFFNSLGNDGSRNFGFQTADGQQRTETTDADGTVRGSYSYMGPDGKEVKINYIADKNGFQASGPTIPIPPPSAAATNNNKKNNGGGKQQDYDYDDGSSSEENNGGHRGGGGGGGHRGGGGGGGGGGHFNFAPQNFQERHLPRFGSANQQQPQPFYGFGGGNRRDGGDYDDGYSGSHRHELGGGQSHGFAPRQNFNKFVDNSQF